MVDCPKCNKDIFSEVYNSRWEDEDMQAHKFICPYCNAKLVTYASVEYDAEEDDEISFDLEKLITICGYGTESDNPRCYGNCSHKDNERKECHHYRCPIAKHDVDTDLMIPYNQKLFKEKSKQIDD